MASDVEVVYPNGLKEFGKDVQCSVEVPTFNTESKRVILWSLDLHSHPLLSLDYEDIDALLLQFSGYQRKYFTFMPIIFVFVSVCMSKNTKTDHSPPKRIVRNTGRINVW